MLLHNYQLAVSWYVTKIFYIYLYAIVILQLITSLYYFVTTFYLTSASQNTSNKPQGSSEPLPFYGKFDEVDDLPQAPGDLRYAFIMFRHGIRSPIYNPFNTQNEFVTMWPDGLGELTADGKRLMFNVGQSLRTRYHKPVPEYKEGVVQFTATRSSRATMSAYCVAAGVFPVQDPVFEEEEGLALWTPIPVLQNALYDKHKLFSEPKEKSHCRRFTAMREQMKRLEQSQTPKMRKEYYKELNSCIFSAYKKPDFAKTLQDNSKAYDTFQAWMLNNKEVPPWITHAMPVMEKMKQMRMWSHIHSKPNMMQYFTGPLFYQIQREMGEVASSDYRRVRMHFHGSHDITMCVTLWATDGDETYFALPGDTVMIEMTAEATVKMYLYLPLEVEKSNRFKNVSLEPLCGKVYCSLDEFKEALKALTFDEEQWKRKCNDDSELDHDFRAVPQDIDQRDLDIMKEAKSMLMGNVNT